MSTFAKGNPKKFRKMSSKTGFSFHAMRFGTTAIVSFLTAISFAQSFSTYKGETIALVANYENRYYAMTNRISSGKAETLEVQFNSEGEVIALTTEDNFNAIRWHVGGSSSDVRLYPYVASGSSYLPSDKSFLATTKGSNYTIDTKNTSPFKYNKDNTWEFKVGTETYLPAYRAYSGCIHASTTDNIKSEGYAVAHNYFLAEHFFRALPAGGADFGTICLHRSARASEVAGATFYEITHKIVDGGTFMGVVVQAVSGDLVAGRPYIYRRKAGAEVLVAALNGDTVETASTRNGLVGCLEDTALPDNAYPLYGDDSSMKCVTIDGKVQTLMAAGCAYIDPAKISKSVSSAGAAKLKGIVLKNDFVVGLHAIPSVHDRTSTLFDLSGRRLSAPPAKGIYIENGQKRVKNEE